MESSIEMQAYPAVSIPYHDGLSLGNTVDVTKTLTRGRKTVDDGTSPTLSKIDSLSCKFCLADKFTHICEVLGIPPEYALKVESGLVQNDVIKTCLADIYNKQAFKLILRLTFIKELIQYTGSVRFNPDSLPASEIPEVCPGVSDLRVDGVATHVVEAVYVGDELIIIMTIAAMEFDALQTFYKKIEHILGGREGFIGKDTMLQTIGNLGNSLDSKLSKSHYKNVTCTIQYGSFISLDEYPTGVNGFAEVVEKITNKWMSACSTKVNPDVTKMIVENGTGEKMDTEESNDINKTSPQIIDVFNLRVTLQPTHGSSELCSSATTPEEYSQTYEAVFSCIYALERTEALIEEFLKCHLFSNEDYRLEGEEICSRVQRRKNQVKEAIESLNMQKPVSTECKQELQDMTAEMPDIVDNFIKKVTTKLPVGGDLNLLIIGKTGHGKSSTANTILRRKEFATSSGGISETKSCQRGWSELDGRTLNIVDIPGVCDTNLDSVDSVQLAVKCISEAISTCSEGFHALLLVIRYGNRMTEEEERAIYMLKCILGQTIVHSHCICVVTHGDNFEDSEGSFEDWCKDQDGFLKQVFEECNYRCVLFDNKTTNPVVQKTQLIELVSKVDSLEHRATCYTNEIFKHTEKDRQRLAEELQLPQFKEEFLRELNLLQDDFEGIENLSEIERKSKLEKLKSRVENLRMKLEDIQYGGVADIYEAISNFSERLHRQEEKELADAQLRLERERFLQKEAQLKAEKEEMERRAAEQAEQIAREAAAAAEQKERELREMERQQLEEKLRHEKELTEVKNDTANHHRKKSRWVRFRDSAFKW